MEMKLSDLFEIEYPTTLIFSKQKEDVNGINFVSSSGKNNGVVARVKENKNAKLYPAGVITVSLKGSVLSAFVQPEKCYVAHQIAVLTPKRKMTLQEKIFYCLCIRENKYKYNYGRQADRTLKDLEVPDEVLESFKNVEMSNYDNINESLSKVKLNLKSKEWRTFKYSDLFDIKKGQRITNSQMKSGEVPCIRPIELNNGVYRSIDIKPNHVANTITISYNGNVGEAFYQPEGYFALDDINVLYPKFNLNPFIAMFIITLIRKEKYRFNYGRKWHLERMNESIIKLPVDKKGNPDWGFMGNFIKGLGYSRELESKTH